MAIYALYVYIQLLFAVEFRLLFHHNIRVHCYWSLHNILFIHMLVHGGIHVSKETNIAAKMKQVEDIKHTTVGEESQQSITTEHNSKLIETTQSYQYSLHNVTVKEYIDPCGAYQVQDRIKHVLKQWENVKPQTPTLFLQKMMVKRGHDATPIPALQSKFKRLFLF